MNRSGQSSYDLYGSVQIRVCGHDGLSNDRNYAVPMRSLVWLIMAAGMAASCAPDSGSLSGHVRDLSGAPIRDSVVTIHFGLGQDAPVRTDDDGHFMAAWSHGNWFENVVA